MASPSATCALVWCACCVHRIFRPTFSDDRETPLLRAEDARKTAGDLPDVASKTACGTLARRANQSTGGKDVKPSMPQQRQCAPSPPDFGYTRSWTSQIIEVG